MEYDLPSNLEDLISHRLNNSGIERVVTCFDYIAAQIDEFAKEPEAFDINALSLEGDEVLRGVDERGVEVIAFFSPVLDGVVILGRDGSVDTLTEWESLIEAEGNGDADSGRASYEQFYELLQSGEGFTMPPYNAIPGEDEALDEDEPEEDESE